MAFRADFHLSDPDTVDCSLTITMPLRDWKRLRSQLSNEYPSWSLSNTIANLVSDAQRHFVEKQEEL